MLAQAKLAETRGKEGPGDQPWHASIPRQSLLDAQTRRQDLHLKALKMGVDLHHQGVDSDHREADRVIDSHHRAADRRSKMALRHRQIITARPRPSGD